MSKYIEVSSTIKDFCNATVDNLLELSMSDSPKSSDAKELYDKALEVVENYDENRLETAIHTVNEFLYDGPMHDIFIDKMLEAITEEIQFDPKICQDINTYNFCIDNNLYVSQGIIFGDNIYLDKDSSEFKKYRDNAELDFFGDFISAKGNRINM